MMLVTPGGYATGLIVYANPWIGGTWARHLGTMPGAAAHLVFGLDEDWICIALSNVSPTRVDDPDDRILSATRTSTPR